MNYRLYVNGKPTLESGVYTVDKLPWAGKKYEPIRHLNQLQRIDRVFLAALVVKESGAPELWEARWI